MAFHDEQAADGRIAADDDRTTPVFSPFTGRVTRVFARAGDVVRRGQPLFAVQATEYLQAQDDLAAARAAADNARAQLKTAEADEARLRELYQADGASLREWQQSQLALATAQTSLRSAQTAEAAVSGRILAYGQDARAVAALQARSAGRAVEPEALVRAPAAGTVISRQIEPGQFVSGMTAGAGAPAFVVSDLSRVWLVANVREADVGRVRLGDPMDVRVLAFPGEVFHAKVTYIAPSVDPVTRRIGVRAEIGNPDLRLKPEMFADFGIDTGAPALSPAVPLSAVTYEGETAHVWVAQPGGRLALRPISAGRSAGGFLEVLAGLRPGDRVATSEALFIDRAARAG
jgi:cobalt-zinc-cadmium efflux system membrane fusion protein